jgi:HEPN domain-containing protein
MKPHETWLVKAKNDLKSSKKLIKGDDAVLDTAIYHTQQCAEKALKGYLTLKEQPLEKTHDVEYLIELCTEYDNEFDNLIEDAEKLNPYSTLYRYPSVIIEPEEEDVHEAIQISEKILNFVEKKIEMSSNEESAEVEVKENEKKEGDEQEKETEL